MSRQITPATTLDSLKKEAKRWLKALRVNDPSVRARLEAIRPRGSAVPTLRDVQHALAREHGVSGWVELKAALDERVMAARSSSERAAEFLAHAAADDPMRHRVAAEMLRRYPDIGEIDLYVATIAGRLDVVERLLRHDPTAATAKGGPHNCEALLYLCGSRVPIPETESRALTIATALLDAGADPNAHTLDPWGNRFATTTVAIGDGEQKTPPHPAAEALVTLLLERGADPYDRQAFYNTSLHDDDDRWLDLLYRYASRTAPADWNDGSLAGESGNGTLDYLLGNAVVANHLRRATWLLSHGAHATTRQFYSKRPLHGEAVRRGFVEMADLLLRHGAAATAISDLEAFQAACMRLDRADAERRLVGHAHFLSFAAPMMWAMDGDRVEVATLLLDLGMSPDVAEHNGKRPLHQAGWANAPRIATLLIERGATVDARDGMHNGTPIGWAIHGNKAEMIELLGRVSRDVFKLTVSGNVERLRTVLRETPSLARELDAHGLTPLHGLPQDDERAAEIVELFLEHGVDSRIVAADGRSAAAVARARGLDDAADLIEEHAAR